ncbi:TonB-dependent receptor [Veillonella sp.]|uniref:TonB-dependent receptor plug domain-containing protein n=1 Tax=Veillonella sp. TaxID=1926307 RepID=UPI0025D40CDF|nr:TonB-dependent receptor [Veillonella sp.]
MCKGQRLGLLVGAYLVGIVGNYTVVDAAFDENLSEYSLGTIVVTADKTKNKFGDTITEQSYYRTGGDVKVITSEEIEKRHYADLTDAIKRIPGITFQNPGYRGGEYGYQFYNNGVSINGDTRVVILVDGRRVDNSASGRISDSSASGSKSTGINLDQLVNISNVDKIEVIKGPGASVYGSDALGGVINIITKKGGDENVGTIDISTGSWHRHNYSISYSGSTNEENPLRYYIAANRSMSQDTKYRDSGTKETVTLGGSKWKEDGVNIRLDKELNEKQNIKFAYTYKAGKDGYPISTPSRKYWNVNDWNRIIFNAAVGQLDTNNVLVGGTLAGDTRNPGYHNLYALDGAGYNSYSKFKRNDYELMFTFDRDEEAGLESFVRLYNQEYRYEDRDLFYWRRPGISVADIQNAYRTQFPNGATNEQLANWIRNNLAPFPGDKEALDKWVAETGGKAGAPRSWHDEKNRGIQLQYAKAFGKHEFIGSVTYDKAKNYATRIERDNSITKSNVERTSIYGYVQDKIHVNDNFDITPALRFAHYSDYKKESANGNINMKGNTNSVTPALNLQYLFNDNSTMYFGWTNILRPLRSGDYTRTNGIYTSPLDDEKGNAWTIGYSKTFNEKTTVGVNYDYTDMSNAIATFPIYDQKNDKFTSTAVNAKEKKQSFNITVDHQINDNLRVGLAYSYMKDRWDAKSGYIVDPSWGYNNSNDINLGINNLRPKNHYTLNVTYERGKLYTGLLANWYTGASSRAFSANRFLVLDWNLNYSFNDDITAYITVTNLTNRAYETSYSAWNGIGSAAMPARQIMVGTRYTF